MLDFVFRYKGVWSRFIESDVATSRVEVDFKVPRHNAGRIRSLIGLVGTMRARFD